MDEKVDTQGSEMSTELECSPGTEAHSPPAITHFLALLSPFPSILLGSNLPNFLDVNLGSSTNHNFNSISQGNKIHVHLERQNLM